MWRRLFFKKKKKKLYITHCKQITLFCKGGERRNKKARMSGGQVELGDWGWGAGEKSWESLCIAGRSNQSVLKEINPEYILEGLMLKFQYFGHLMRRTDSMEKTLMLAKIEGRQLLELAQIHVHRVSDAIQPSHPLLSPSPPTFSLSQHQGLFKWVTSSHQVAKILELQHQSSQWIFRTDFL